MTEDMFARAVDDRNLELGEGPSYDPLTDKAYWFDILGKTLYEMDCGSEAVTAYSLPRMASEIAGIDAGRQLVAMEDGFYIRDRASGDLELHLPLEADNPDTRSNDGGIHPAGALWIGTMSKSGVREAGSIYHYRAGKVTRLFEGISIPNGICFSADGETGYFCDTAVNRLMRVELDPKTGLPTGEPEVFHDQTGGKGALDGASVDEAGNLWIALWGASGVLVLTPQGEVIRTVEIPTRQPTCAAFIGRSAERLLVTTAWEHMEPERRAIDKNAGKTFILEPVARGRHAPPVVIA
ncbi:SMP-30/gluconolactonase/LRE family protein [Fulvimarina sp. MAC3]|uniref:SMP-30/gluconolactonase/LRE family protein n=1 Tax=Fulvimarina sp. MAC3 TaxID=3148887 RepID=UPI0031FDB8B7